MAKVRKNVHQFDEGFNKAIFPEPPTNVGQEKESDWEEMRFLQFLTWSKKCAEKRAAKLHEDDHTMASSPFMTPGGGYVTLEASELRKLFDEHGNAKNRDDLTPLTPPRERSNIDGPKEEKELQEWPDTLFMNYHGLSYNKSEQCEERDLELMAKLRKHVGNKETASTCHGLNEVSTVVNKPLSRSNSTKSLPREDDVPAVRRSPRKKAVVAKRRLVPGAKAAVPGLKVPTPQQRDLNAKSASASETKLKSKVRYAVFKALEEKGIGEKDAIFRPCFKKLFDITKAFAGSGGSSTEMLKVVARENSELIIKMEKGMFGKMPGKAKR